MTSVFLDTNVQIYAVGRPHALRDPCREIIRTIARRPAPFFTNAEVLQELLHRYRSLRAWDNIGRDSFVAFAQLLEGRIEPIFASDVERAADLADDHLSLDARDLLHLAVMERVGATAIITADTSFDNLDGIERLDPVKVKRWLSRFEDASV
jgi:predicted nucleic acid-binding protein